MAKTLWIPKGKFEYIVKMMYAKPNPKDPTHWKYCETGFGIRFHGNKRGVQHFVKKTGKGSAARKFIGPPVMMKGGIENLLSALEVAYANFYYK